jgi:hypothetical protein
LCAVIGGPAIAATRCHPAPEAAAFLEDPDGISGLAQPVTCRKPADPSTDNRNRSALGHRILLPAQSGPLRENVEMQAIGFMPRRARR